MGDDFKVGDHVEWNSEAGRVQGTIKEENYARYVRNRIQGVLCSRLKGEPQYLIKSDKTDHLALHKGSALKKISKK